MFVVLATYHDDLEVPAGVVIMRKERFQELRNKGVSLPHLADYIRLRMMQGDGGWLLDVNVLWLRPPPKQTEELNFHMFSSLRARPGSTWQGKLAEFRKWSTQYLAMPGDELFVATPFYAPASSLWPAELVRKMELHFNDSGFGDYNGIMQLSQELLSKHGLEQSVSPWSAFCPLHYWSSSPLKKRKESEGEATRILEDPATFGVAAFWQSIRTEKSQFQVAEQGSTWRFL
ncbi:unnamed protein product [Durusdinium trenchii]|uniref:Uncharacterized protein n=2 Tax=Durusdinium trenchii TaxID=1381693 RepID=A0ABP0QZ89_9DINO